MYPYPSPPTVHVLVFSLPLSLPLSLLSLSPPLSLPLSLPPSLPLLQGMLERVGTYLSHQNFCDGEDLALGKAASASSVHEDHTAAEAIDGLLTEKTCFWSAPDVNHW